MLERTETAVRFVIHASSAWGATARDSAVVRAVAVLGPRYTIEIYFRGSRLVGETARSTITERPLPAAIRIAACVANAIVFPARSAA
jgi:hypothetical protein